MKQKPENLIRANRISKAIKLKPHLGEAEKAISSALTDLRHLCDKHALDFGALDKAAYRNYLDEKYEGKN